MSKLTVEAVEAALTSIRLDYRIGYATFPNRNLDILERRLRNEVLVTYKGKHASDALKTACLKLRNAGYECDLDREKRATKVVVFGHTGVV